MIQNQIIKNKGSFHSSIERKLEDHNEEDNLKEALNQAQNKNLSAEEKEVMLNKEEVPILNLNPKVEVENNENIMNVDEIPIGAKQLTFDELLQKELEKGDDNKDSSKTLPK